MSNYRRMRIVGGTWFFTVNLYDRNSDLLVRHIAELRQAVRRVKQRHPFKINAWVVLPDHMHCVWTLPAEDCNYSRRWQMIKKIFSKSIAAQELISDNQKKRGERAVWQRRFWEHNIRSERDYQTHVDYVYINPLKHGLVRNVSDWPYSSFHRDVGKGLYPQEWAGDVGEVQAGERK